MRMKMENRLLLELVPRMRFQTWKMWSKSLLRAHMLLHQLLDLNLFRRLDILEIRP
jgi:hypothetical protein